MFIRKLVGYCKQPESIGATYSREQSALNKLNLYEYRSVHFHSNKGEQKMKRKQTFQGSVPFSRRVFGVDWGFLGFFGGDFSGFFS